MPVPERAVVVDGTDRPGGIGKFRDIVQMELKKASHDGFLRLRRGSDAQCRKVVVHDRPIHHDAPSVQYG